MDAMARLLSDELEPLIFRSAHGFRVAKGARTFFNDVSRWPQMDWLVQCDIVRCCERIGHGPLLYYLLSRFGEENAAFVDRRESFLVIDILDRDGVNHGHIEIGIPEGSPSPVLRNFFLHQLDRHFKGLNIPTPIGDKSSPVRVYFARYAYTILFGIPQIHFVIANTAKAKERARIILKYVCEKLQLSTVRRLAPTCGLAFNGLQVMLEVLGLPVSPGVNGQINVHLFTEDFLISTKDVIKRMKGRQTKEKFLRILFSSVEISIRLHLQYPLSASQVSQLRCFLRHFILKRSQEFVLKTDCSLSGVPGKTSLEEAHSWK